MSSLFLLRAKGTELQPLPVAAVARAEVLSEGES